jgi:hypothetical protein
VRRERPTAEQPAGEVGEADFRRGQNFVINRYYKYVYSSTTTAGTYL